MNVLLHIGQGLGLALAAGLRPFAPALLMGALASASVIQYDPADPSGADWYELTAREDGSWVRKAAEGEPPPVFGEKETRRLLEWLVG